MRLGEIINQYRKEHNLSMEAFGEKSGMTKGYISMLENGNKITGTYPAPTVTKIRGAAAAMNMDVNTLWRLIDDDILLDESKENDSKYHNSHILPDENIIIEKFKKLNKVQQRHVEIIIDSFYKASKYDYLVNHVINSDSDNDISF